MSLESSLTKVPFTGNLMVTSYKIVRNGMKGSANIVDMECKTVLLKGLDPSFDVDGLIFTEAELKEARDRYERYASQISETDKEISDTGTVYIRSYTSTGAVKKIVELNLVYMHDGDTNKRSGYLFKDTDINNTIVPRTKRLPGTVIRPTFWQKCKIKFVKLITGFPEED